MRSMVEGALRLHATPSTTELALGGPPPRPGEDLNARLRHLHPPSRPGPARPPVAPVAGVEGGTVVQLLPGTGRGTMRNMVEGAL